MAGACRGTSATPTHTRADSLHESSAETCAGHHAGHLGGSLLLRQFPGSNPGEPRGHFRRLPRASPDDSRPGRGGGLAPLHRISAPCSRD
ncbi:unnamed protein product [Symbiodinium necroappetens]|uniref:Uncharacterized protein n=1 Tax=Symbiodinium necroappetens TaxID=1628268 RepID=A0A812QBU4_9DINO|nr:unnamed protein product [Symbiodinium necroappetens]